MAKDTVGYELIATAEDATKKSNPFSVADQFGQFADGQGPSGQDDPGTTQVSTIVNGAAGNNLGITVDATIPIRLDLCGGGNQVGSGTVFEVVESTGDPQTTSTSPARFSSLLSSTPPEALLRTICASGRETSRSTPARERTTACRTLRPLPSRHPCRGRRRVAVRSQTTPTTSTRASTGATCSMRAHPEPTRRRRSRTALVREPRSSYPRTRPAPATSCSSLRPVAVGRRGRLEVADSNTHRSLSSPAVAGELRPS